MQSFLNRRYFLGILLLFLLSTISVGAQSLENAVSIDVIPTVPGPNENVTITLTSYATNLDAAKITWAVDGKVKLSNFGAKKFSFTSGKVGTTTTVGITMILSTGETVKKSVVVRPAEADLLWEASDSYTPPFYKGLPLPASEGTIRVVAMPNIKNASASLIYNWKKNFIPDQQASGYGKSAYVFRSSYLNKTENIEAVISSPTGSYTATKSLSLVTLDPEIIFYKKNALDGMKYNHALVGNFGMKEPETTLVAEPYYYSPKNKESSSLTYTWKLNNQTVSGNAKKSELVVRKGDNTEGVARLDLGIESLTKLFQNEKTTLMVDLGAK